MAKTYSIANVNGNAYAVMGAVVQIMSDERKTMGWDSAAFENEKQAYLDSAMSSDYDNLLAVSKNMVGRVNSAILANEAANEKFTK